MIAVSSRKSERWETSERLFEVARRLGRKERSGFLNAACDGDVEMQKLVNSLLEHDSASDTFLYMPAVELLGLTFSTGDVIGRYSIMKLAGSGGMGHVYRARDSRLERDVAIKTLPFQFVHDAERRARLQREATLLAAVNHPNIASIYDILECEGIICLVLEFVDGCTLSDRIRKNPSSINDALYIAGQIAEALQAAHMKGIVHRDLKPANIKITPDHRVKLLDFSLAKAVGEPVIQYDPDHVPIQTSGFEPTRFAGTPGYMSPEQALGCPVDARCDIWGFGCVLFELLTGRKIFEGQSQTDVITSLVQCEPDWTLLPPGIPPELEHLLRDCLRTEVKARLCQAAELAQRIRDLQLQRI
jgi:serine/threonine-protein kinase